MKILFLTKPISRQLHYFLAYITFAFLVLIRFALICIYLYQFRNVFVQMLKHIKQSLGFLTRWGQCLRAFSPGGWPGTLLRLSSLLRWLDFLYLLLLTFILFYFIFLKLILQNLPKKDAWCVNFWVLPCMEFFFNSAIKLIDCFYLVLNRVVLILPQK